MDMEKMTVLTKDEAQSINGGGSAFHWTGRVLGSIAEFLADLGDSLNSPEGQAMYNALQDCH